MCAESGTVSKKSQTNGHVPCVTCHTKHSTKYRKMMLATMSKFLKTSLLVKLFLYQVTYYTYIYKINKKKT